MIDTIHEKFLVQIDERMLGPEWVKTTKVWKRGLPDERNMVKYETSFKVGYAFVVVRYYPCDYSNCPLLVVEISSLPKVINETNAQPLTNVQIAYDVLNSKIRSIAGVPDWIDVRDGHVLRVDIYHDYSLGNECKDYLSIISQLIYPYREKAVYTNQNSHGISNGMFFYTKTGPALRFYNKGIESGVRDYYGVLRQESCVKGVESLTWAFGSPSPILCQITEEMQTMVILNDLFNLGLNNPFIGDSSIVLDNLKDKYGIATAYRLRNTIEVLSKNNVFNISVISSELGIKKSTLYRRMKQIKEAGVVAALLPGNKRLESLTDLYWSEYFPINHRNNVVIPVEIE